MARAQSRADIILSLKNNMSTGLAKATRQLRKFGSQAKRIGLAFAGMSTALAAGMGKTILMAANLNDELRKIASKISGVSYGSKVFNKLEDEVNRLGRTTSFTASEVAQLMTVLAQGGKNAQQIEMMTEHVMAFAKAASGEAAQAADLLIVALNGFGLVAEESQRAVDVMTASINGSSQSMSDFQEAMTVIAPSANAVGLSIERTAAMINVLADAGIRGSIAGRQLRSALIYMATTGADSLNDLGISIMDAGGEMRDFASIVDDVNNSTRGMGAPERIAVFKDVFGKVGINAVQILARSSDGLAHFDTLLNRAKGSAKAASDEMEAGFGGVLRRLNSAVMGLAEAVGKHLTPYIEDVTKLITTLANSINAKLVAKALVSVLKALALLATVFLGLGYLIQGLTFSFSMLNTAMLGTAGAIATVVRTAVPITKGLGNFAKGSGRAAVFAWNLTKALSSQAARLGATAIMISRVTRATRLWRKGTISAITSIRSLKNTVVFAAFSGEKLNKSVRYTVRELKFASDAYARGTMSIKGYIDAHRNVQAAIKGTAYRTLNRELAGVRAGMTKAFNTRGLMSLQAGLKSASNALTTEFFGAVFKGMKSSESMFTSLTRTVMTFGKESAKAGASAFLGQSTKGKAVSRLTASVSKRPVGAKGFTAGKLKAVKMADTIRTSMTASKGAIVKTMASSTKNIVGAGLKLGMKGLTRFVAPAAIAEFFITGAFAAHSDLKMAGAGMAEVFSGQFAADLLKGLGAAASSLTQGLGLMFQVAMTGDWKAAMSMLTGEMTLAWQALVGSLGDGVVALLEGVMNYRNSSFYEFIIGTTRLIGGFVSVIQDLIDNIIAVFTLGSKGNFNLFGLLGGESKVGDYTDAIKNFDDKRERDGGKKLSNLFGTGSEAKEKRQFAQAELERRRMYNETYGDIDAAKKRMRQKEIDDAKRTKAIQKAESDRAKARQKRESEFKLKQIARVKEAERKAAEKESVRREMINTEWQNSLKGISGQMAELGLAMRDGIVYEWENGKLGEIVEDLRQKTGSAEGSLKKSGVGGLGGAGVATRFAEKQAAAQDEMLDVNKQQRDSLVELVAEAKKSKYQALFN
jgi:TP901 family phage tail tape measure protein